MKIRPSFLWIGALGLAAVLAGAIMARLMSQTTVPLASGTWLSPPRSLAPFTLTDTAGEPYTEQQLLGHPSLVFFGFTYCPDVCPTTLATVAEVLRGEPVAGLAPIFVSVDPERDTGAVLHQYLHAFSPDFIGLRTDPKSMPGLLASFGAIAERQELPGGGYTMDHSATLYLLDRRGRIAAVFSPPFAAPALRADLKRIAAAGVL
jgi:protein SCO1/2